MRAVVLEEIGSIKVKDIPVPEAAKEQFLLKVLKCTLCRTDAKMLQLGQRDLILPRVLGHEICALDEKTGKKYAIWPGSSCGKCKYCTSGLENMCNKMQVLGFHID